MNRTLIVAVVAALGLGPTAAARAAEDPAVQRGSALMREAVERDSGFGNYVTQGTMLLSSPDGAQAERVFLMRTLEAQGDGDKRLVTFDEPKDLSGMAALIYSHGRTADDQWLYLPSLRRTKRLAARDKTGSFAGSEFSFEDVATFEYDKYTYRLLGEETIGGKKCTEVEQTPVYEYSGYSKLIECLDLTIWQPLRIRYFDMAGRPYKELTFHDYRQYGRYHRPDRSTMRNLQSNAESTILWADYQFATDLSADDFRPDVLRRYSR